MLLVQINDDQEDLQKDLELVLDSPTSEASPQEAPVQDTSKSPKPSSSSSSPPEHKESRSHSTSPPPKPDRSQQVLRSLRHCLTYATRTSTLVDNINTTKYDIRGGYP